MPLARLLSIAQARVTAAGRYRNTRASLCRWLAAHHASHPGVPGAVSYNLLMLVGTVIGGWQLSRAALAASAELAAGAGDRAFCKAKLLTARFYATQIMPAAVAWRRGIEAGCEPLLDMPEEQF